MVRISALLIDKRHPLLNLGSAILRLRIPSNKKLLLLIWDFHFKRTFEPLYADVEIISTCFSLTEFSVIKNITLSRVFLLGNRHILELGSWDGLLTKYYHVIFLMTLLVLPEI